MLRTLDVRNIFYNMYVTLQKSKNNIIFLLDIKDKIQYN